MGEPRYLLLPGVDQSLGRVSPDDHEQPVGRAVPRFTVRDQRGLHEAGQRKRDGADRDGVSHVLSRFEVEVAAED